MKIHTLFRPPRLNDPDKNRAGTLLFGLLGLTFAAFSLLGLSTALFQTENISRALNSIVIVAILSMISLVLLHNGNIVAASTLFVFQIWFAVTVSAITGGGMETPAVQGYILVVLAAGLLIGWRWGLAAGLISTITQLTITYFETNHLFSPFQGVRTPLTYFIVYTLVSGLAVIFVYYYFQELKHRNRELALAYNVTLEGWSKALDLRDKETEGHSMRVTEMTMSLARMMELSDNDLARIRQGALLHDVGKLGIPDKILLKTSKLTEVEWAIMKNHPTYAYEWLSPIAYLQPSLDIPHYHHEKWDGSGYPEGLSGESIPLSARLFAIVDVYDALTSNRPYRQAWSKEKALKYIQNESGKHFDPQVVKIFSQLINEEDTAR